MAMVPARIPLDGTGAHGQRIEGDTPMPAPHDERREDHPDNVEAALVRVADMGPQVDAMHEAIRAVREMLEEWRRPASFETIRLTAGIPERRSDVSPGIVTASFGLINPSPIVVYLGIGGNRAGPGVEAISVPRNSFAVIPVGGSEIGVGADPADLAAGDVIVHLFRFPTRQPLFLQAM